MPGKYTMIEMAGEDEDEVDVSKVWFIVQYCTSAKYRQCNFP